MIKDIKYIVIIIFMSILCFTTCDRKQREIDDLKKRDIIINDTLSKIDSTQYRKVVADTLTESQLRKRIKELEIALKGKPKTILETQIVPYPVEKIVDSLVYVNGSINLTDYYPKKDNYFIKYTLTDSVSNFSFNPIKLSIALSETNDGVWRVDSKVPEFINITDITAVGLKREEAKKRSPFYIGGGLQKQNEKYPLSVLGGFKVKNTIIFGGVNTEGQVELKTLYNL